MAALGSDPTSYNLRWCVLLASGYQASLARAAAGRLEIKNRVWSRTGEPVAPRARFLVGDRIGRGARHAVAPAPKADRATREEEEDERHECHPERCRRRQHGLRVGCDSYLRTWRGVGVHVDIVKLVYLSLDVRVEGDIHQKRDKGRCTREERCERCEQTYGDVARQTQ